MKIETRVETLRRVEVELSLPEYESKLAEEMGDPHSTWHEGAAIEDTKVGPSPVLMISDSLYSMSRSRWEAFKKLGDAAWEAWDKTFGDKRPETMGVWRYGNESICASSVEFLPSAFVWYPGDKDYVGLAQKALDALKAEKPEWKLELREYTKSETSK